MPLSVLPQVQCGMTYLSYIPFRLKRHAFVLFFLSQSPYGAEVLTSSFCAISPHRVTVAAFYGVLNVKFFMLFATVRFKA